MKIQLDTKALESLFPEGSEARIELQNAVIKNFVNKAQFKNLDLMVYDAIHNCDYEFKKFIRENLNKQLNERFAIDTANSWVKGEIKPQLPNEELLNEIAHITVDSKLNQFIKDFDDGAEEIFNNAYKNFIVKYKHLLDSSIRAYVLGNCNDIINEIVREKIKELL